MAHPIIALWSHPRSMSTAFERTMRARGDLACLHEPFMYDYYINRAKRQMPHFQAKPDQPQTYEAIRDAILARAESGPVFLKDMSYYVMPHVFDDADFVQRVTHSFLVREPLASILSYVKLDPDVTLEEIGIEAQWQHVERLLAGGGKPVVVQSEKIQADPAGQMRRYWQAVGLDDKPQALDWGDRPPEDWQQVSGWHQDVMASSSIRPLDAAAEQKSREEFSRLIRTMPHLQSYLDHHAAFHQRLAEMSI